ncbi:CHAD domain-containing protein [Achromobacter insuavis]|uniref:CHAD domain-containing protein n=1 Tax=Achromobacter insuavis TaxID=1287735 RepID=UPI000E3069CB|nr:CHAD domain-containing protein [Achromobacter insuavis]
MTRSTKPTTANGGSARETAGAKPSSAARPNGNDAAAPSPLQDGLHAVAAIWFGEIHGRVRRLREGETAVGQAAPDLIHDLRIYVRRLCALSDLLPRPAERQPLRRALRREVAWAMQPLSRARDWDVFMTDVLPRLCEAEPDIDSQVSLRRAGARSNVAHAEMYASLRDERFDGMVRLLRERSDEMRVALAERKPKALYNAMRRRLGRWDAALRGRLESAGQGARREHQTRIEVKRLRYATEALLQLCPSRNLERYAQTLAGLQAALGGTQDLRTAARLAPDTCISLSTGKLARQGLDDACRRLRRQTQAEARKAGRRFLRSPSFWSGQKQGRVARRLAQGTAARLPAAA